MKKQLIFMSFCLISFNLIAMNSTSPRLCRNADHAIAPKEQRRMNAQKPLVQPAPSLASVTSEDVSVDMHGGTLSRVILDPQEHLQMLRRRNTWASDDGRLRMFDDSSVEESCMQMARRCGCINADTCSCMQQTALHCMSLQSMVFYFDLLKLLTNHLNQ